MTSTHILGPGSSWTNKETRKLESTLGPNYLNALEEIIDAKMLQHQDEHTDNHQHITEFLSVHEKWRADYWQQLQKAENFLTQYRRSNDMRPFNWSVEQREGVFSILGLDAGKPRYPRTIEKRQEIAIRAFLSSQNKGDSIQVAIKTGNASMLRRCTKLKPEYQGSNHPLELNQVIRK